MKYKIALIIILFPLFANAQTGGNLDSLVKSVIAELKESWTLGVDSNSNVVDINLYNKYKSLFDSSARVDDDLNFRFIPGKKSGSYKIVTTPKDFDEYAHDVALQVSKLRVDTAVVESLHIYSNDSIVLMAKRTLYVEKPKKYVLQNADTLVEQIIQGHPGIFEKTHGRAIPSDSTGMNLLKQQISQDLNKQISKDADSLYKFISTSYLRITMSYTADSVSPLKIKRIENTGNSLTCINDDDNDGVLNQIDLKQQEYGELTANGQPDADLDGVPDNNDKCRGTYGSAGNKGCPVSYFTTNKQLQVFIGAQSNSPQIKLPELNKLGYIDNAGNDAMDVLQSQKGTLKNPGQVNGFFAGGNLAFYFGKNAKKSGISIGLTYARFVAEYELTAPIRYTYKASDGTNEYRRQVSIRNLQEEITNSVINVPVQFDFRFKPFSNNSWVINLKTGPSLLLFNSTSDYNATIDFGGIYQIDTLSKDKVTYYNILNPSSTYNIYLTSNGINQQNTNPGAAAVFAQLPKSYDFASNKNYRDKQKLTRATFAFNFSLNGQYKKNKDNPLALTVGAHFMYAPLPEQKTKYKPIDKTTDSFNSIFNSSARSTYFAYGLMVGFAYDL